MFLLYILAFTIHGVFSTTPCKDGVEIVSTDIKNPEDLLGNWINAYHWVPMKSHNDYNQQSKCPRLHFEKITPALMKAKEAECANHKIPFNWADAKLKMVAPTLNIEAGVITFGEKENWLLMDCTTMVRVVIRKVSDDYIAFINSESNSESELLVREPPTLDELKCVAHNVDVGKGMSGFGVCYKK